MNECLRDKTNETSRILNPKIPRYESVILFQNNSGQAGEFTLSDNWENYKIIEVFFTRSEFEVSSSRVHTDLAKNSKLPMSLNNNFYGYGTGFWTSWKQLLFTAKNKIVTVSGNGNGYVTSDNGSFRTSSEESIKILKVIGYK